MLGAYTYPRFFGNIRNEESYVLKLCIIYCVLLLVWGSYKIWKKAYTIETNTVMNILFLGMVGWLTGQYWDTYQSITIIRLGNILPVLFLFVFYKCTFVQAYLWEVLYLTNVALIKQIYITYVGTFNDKYFEEFFSYPRIHTYSEIIYLIIIYMTIFFVIKHLSISGIIKRLLYSYKNIVCCSNV